MQKIKLFIFSSLLILIACSSNEVKVPVNELVSDTANSDSNNKVKGDASAQNNNVPLISNDSDIKSNKNQLPPMGQPNPPMGQPGTPPMGQPGTPPMGQKFNPHSDLSPNGIGLAQKLYPPDVIINLLVRRIPWPQNFDLCLSKSVDMNSLQGTQKFSGRILDEASMCLLNLDVDPRILINSNMPPMGQPGTPPMGQPNPPMGQPGTPPMGQPGTPPMGQPNPPMGQPGTPSMGQPNPPMGQPGTPSMGQQMPPKGHQPPPGRILKVTKQSTNYSSAIPTSKKLFTNNQDASLWLSGYGFNKSGGATLFNHPVAIASDGKRLAVTDRNNNRILIWESIPNSNVAPDLVIGQPDFETHMEGKSLAELDFPGQVSISSDGKMVVADSNNDRILVWTKFPTQSGQSADYAINIDSLIGTQGAWPWGAWTDGKKLVVSVTSGGDNGSKIIIWNSFPTSGLIRPDLTVKNSSVGTPRMIVSNGEYILTGDENGKTECKNGSNSHIWASWPVKNNQPPDACLGGWVGGTIVGDSLITIAQGGESLKWWNKLPKTIEEGLDFIPVSPGVGHTWRGGDGNDAIYVDGKLFIVEYNGGRVSVFNELPSGPDQKPDWALGIEDPSNNPYYENWIIQNGVPASNGEKLFISSDFDRSLSVWNKIPGESGVAPDLFYRRFENAPWDISVYNNTVFLAGQKGIYGWENFDGTGELPEIEIDGSIGSISLNDLRGVTYNGKYFALSSEKDNKVWIWEGIPDKNTAPIYTLDVPEGPGRLDSNDEWLIISGYPADRFNVKVIKFSDLPNKALRNIPNHNSFPQSAVITDIGFFVSQQSKHQVIGWDSVEAALAGKPPSNILGSGKGTKASNAIKMANSMAWDGSQLWVGEFKFGTRILGFRPTK
jgi:hypothetical protein